MGAFQRVLSGSRPKIVLIQQADELRDLENMLYDRTLGICTKSARVHLETIRRKCHPQMVLMRLSWLRTLRSPRTPQSRFVDRVRLLAGESDVP